MKISTFPISIRTFYTFSNYSARATTPYKALTPFTCPTLYKSMPTIPFLSSLFSSNSALKMSYPVQKSDDEWQAVLSKGSHTPPPPMNPSNKPQNSSELLDRRAPKLPSQANMISTCQRKVSTHVQPATRPFTKQIRNSNLVADGQRILTTSPAP